jgi:hypothetical protein
MDHGLEDKIPLSLAAFDRRVPPRAYIGDVAGPDDPSYLLWGRNLSRRIYYLPAVGAVDPALLHGVFYVVINLDSNAPTAGQFRQDGWKVIPLGRYWLLARAPGAGSGVCYLQGICRLRGERRVGSRLPQGLHRRVPWPRSVCEMH